MNEPELRDRLRRAAGDDDAAQARAWALVKAAYARREPARGRRRRRAAAAGAAVLAGVAVAGGVAAGAPRWVQDVLRGDEPRARPALVRVPGGGSLLVRSGRSAWMVAPDGARRRLGSFAGAAWSPRGRFVIAWRGRELTALEPGGRVRWSRSAPARVAHARWAPVDGFRIAYLAGGDLRIVAGDGTADRRYGPAGAVPPAWRPGAGHVLAYLDGRDRVAVVAVDGGRRLWRTRPLPGVTRLAWAGRKRLLAVADGRLLRLDARRRAAPAGPAGVQEVAPAPRGGALALLRAAPGGTDVLLVRGGRERVLLTAPGRLGAPAWSPDGARLLVPWPAADQWLFLRPDGGRTVAVGDIARQFAPGAARAPFPGAVTWCCPPP